MMTKFVSAPVAFLLLLGTAVSTRESAPCPPENKISPCTCRNGIFYDVIGTRVSCRDIKDPQDLKTIIQNFRGYKINLLEFIFVDLQFLPAELFSGTWVQRIEIKDSIIENLYSLKEYGLSPFDGLDESLEELRVTGTRDPSKWLWPNMKNLKKLKLVEFQQSPIDFVGHVFAEIGKGSLESMTAAYSRVYRIHPQAFSELRNLSHVNFEGNFIPYMSRTMFPNPAPKLTSINLRYNSLDTLPEDMFFNMPNLRSLDLSENKLRIFPEVMYTPIWDHLHFFYIHGNPLVCDCKLQWLRSKLREKTYPSNTELQSAKCSSPPDLAGLTLGSLSDEQLIC